MLVKMCITAMGHDLPKSYSKNHETIILVEARCPTKFILHQKQTRVKYTIMSVRRRQWNFELLITHVHQKYVSSNAFWTCEAKHQVVRNSSNI